MMSDELKAIPCPLIFLDSEAAMQPILCETAEAKPRELLMVQRECCSAERLHVNDRA